MKNLLLLLFCFIASVTTSVASDDVEFANLLNLDTETVAENNLFKSNCSQKDSKINCTITPNNDIYIYKDSIKIDSHTVDCTNLLLPKGLLHKDSSGEKEIYTKEFEISFDISNAKQFDPLLIQAQGCDSNGICYPKASSKFVIEKDVENNTNLNNQDMLFSHQDSLALILLLALVFGAALDLTPCSLPLLSIYSATILGTNSSKKEAIINNSAYCISLALGYCFIGILFSYIGVSAHGFLQHPVTCVVLAFILLALALHTLDILKLPPLPSFNGALQTKLSTIKNGTIKKAVVMGLLSALFTTPCTSAPLTGALIYVMTTNSIVKGALIFFAIGLGMGLPLVIIGLFGNKALKVFKNKTSAIKKILALPLIITALLVCKHLLGEYEQLVSIATYSICLFALINLLLHNKFEHKKILIATIAIICLFTVGFIVQQKTDTKVPFEPLNKLEELHNYKGQKIYLSVSAKWCSNCHILDKELYSQNDFKELTKEYKLLRYDFTDMDSEESKALAERFNMIGVPYAVILDENLDIVKSYTGTVSKEILERDL